MTIPDAESRGRVLHVLRALDFGGVESQMRIVAAHASLSGWNHAFCAIGPGGAVLEDLRSLGAEACALNRPTKIPSPKAIWALARFLRRTRPDMVQLYGAEAMFHGIIAARLARVPVVICEEIGIPRHSAKARRVFARLYRHADRIIAISEAVKRAIVDMHEARPEMIEVVYNPFEPQPFRPFPSLGGRIELGFAGRLEAVKNPMATVEAARMLRDRGLDFRLRLVGEGSLRPALAERIADLKLADCVFLEGFHPHPFALLEGCHLYLQPSVTEGFGLAICEAMSAGIPVIATGAGGTPEVIDHGRTGWLLSEPDAAHLAEAVERAIALGPSALAEVGRMGSTRVRERFSPQTFMRRCDEVYESLLQDRGRA